MTPFEKTPRKTNCAICGEQCLRMFTKTKDGRPWPANMSICNLCLCSFFNAAREIRLAKAKAREAA